MHQTKGKYMLILTRRPQESIKIADDITITVLGIRGCQVRLGFNAPREISIQREEIYLKKIDEKDIQLIHNMSQL